MQISTVLFDADGVLQFAEPLYTHVEERQGWPRRRLNDFFHHVFHEREDYDGSDTGEVDPVPVFGAALAEWGWHGTVREFVHAWLTLGTVPDPEAMDLVADLRRAGVVCGLATNQETVRARYMDEQLGYGELFDHCFYSSYLGVAKPDGAFFRAALAALGTDPGTVLFVDDHETNVTAARECGLHAEVHHPGSRLRDTLAGYALPG